MTPINIMNGDDNDNSLYGGSQPDMISGKGGNDFLAGGEGNDTLDGGAGNDMLLGGSGNNTFRFGRGAGQDVIERGDPLSVSNNVLQLGEGVAPSELRLNQAGEDLILGIAGTQDTLTLRQFFTQPPWMREMHWNYQVSEIAFADGMRWDMHTIMARLKLSNAPLVQLDDSDNLANGPALDGGGGNDRLYGASSYLSGGSGNDSLYGASGGNVLRGGSGDDVLTGGSGDDWLDGGSGNDVLNGDGGYDTYRFGYGSGHDTIGAPRSGQGDMLTIDMAAGVQPGTLTFLRPVQGGPDLVIELPHSGERLTVKDYFTTPRIVTVHFADGSVMKKQLIDMKVNAPAAGKNLTGSAAADQLYGSYASDILRGAGGDDMLIGQEGDDLLIGGDGNDVLDGGDGNDYFDGGAGNDRILVGRGYANGPTVMLFGRASGHDELMLSRGDASMTVLLDAGITGADIGVLRLASGNGNDLLVSVGGQQASIRVPNYFVPTSSGEPPVFFLQFADGTVWDATLIGNALLTGNEANNTLEGGSGNDRIDARGGDDMLRGMQGNDVLLGGDGRDTLLGGEGDDTLNGGRGDDVLDDQSGNNTYVFARGDGRDMIFNSGPAAQARYQTIVFADGISPGQVALKRVDRGAWDDLVLAVDGEPGQEIMVHGFAYNDPRAATNMELKEIRFADGSQWDMAAILQRLGTGTDAGETLLGSKGSDRLDGKGGDDTLAGRGGDDQLIGGPGADTYVFNLGDGRDSLVDLREGAGLGNTIRFGPGIVSRDVRVTERGADLEIAYGSGGDVIVLGNAAARPADMQAVERIVFADGSVHSFGAFLNHAPLLARPLADLTVGRGQVVNLGLLEAFSDPDAADTLSLAVSLADGTPLPSWLAFDGAGNTLAGVAPDGPSTSYQLRVTATDRGGLRVADEFTLAVDAPNRAPVVERPHEALFVREDERLAVSLPAFADPDAGDVLSYKMSMADGSPLPSWMWFNGKDLVTGVPNFNTAGTYQLQATATDQDGLSVSSNVDLVVTNVNRAPAPLQGLGILDAAQGTPLTIVLPAATLADPDGDILSYAMTTAQGLALPAWLTFDPLSLTLSGTPAAGDSGPLALVLNGTDSGGLTGAAPLNLHVATQASLSLPGTAGDDVLDGMAGHDVLLGLAGNDDLNGMAGNDVLDGGDGADFMTGGAGDDRYLVDSVSDWVFELAGEGRDTVIASVGYNLRDHLESLVLGGTLALDGGGNDSDNVLTGNSGNNRLTGDGGNDILQGGAGDDMLVDPMGKNLFDGGSGADRLADGANAALFFGGAGNDAISPGGGVDIIAFNRGDGSDVVSGASQARNVISLGHGIGYADLTFARVGDDLVLGTGAGEQISLASWFFMPAYRNVTTLQIFIDGSSDYQAGSPAPMHAQPIQLFNFDLLASRFELALRANPALSSWSLAPELAGAWTGASATAAIGGDLAQQIATNGNLANVAQVLALAIIGSATFGAGQLLGEPAGLADGSAWLM